jgi:homoserine kinase type II
MSVYTSISDDELRSFLADYDAGTLESFEGIESGIENTNYFVTTDRGDYVLTIFEQHTREELGFFLELTAWLAEHEIPCAHPSRNRADRYLGELHDKPAALVDRLPGASVEDPDPQQCAAVGQVLARLHLAGRDFPHDRANDRGPHWWRTTASAVLPKLEPADRELLQAELAYQMDRRAADLPRGIIHADLFRDNVLFQDHGLSGLIDFYYACRDVLLYDLAVTVNDWCSKETGELDSERARAMLGAYNSIRPLGETERTHWQAMLRAAALRFWLSRLQDMHFPREGEMTHIKDPDVFRRILVQRAAPGGDARELWPGNGAQRGTA